MLKRKQTLDMGNTTNIDILSNRYTLGMLEQTIHAKTTTLDMR